MLDGNVFLTYSPLIFEDLRGFLKNADQWFVLAGAAFLDKSGGGTEVLNQALQALPPAVSIFLKKENFPEKLREIRLNTNTAETFRTRFFRWFDPFLAMKYVHYARDHFFPNVPVEEAARVFLQKEKEKPDARELLMQFRTMDRQLFKNRLG